MRVCISSTGPEEQACLGKFQDRFLVCRNKPENDLYWDTQDAGMIGKVAAACSAFSAL